MVNSISSQNYVVQQTAINTRKAEYIEEQSSKLPESIKNIDTRKNAISFIENATPRELEARVNSLVGRMPSMAMINLNEIMNSDHGFEIVERIGLLQGQMDQENRSVLNKEQDLITQGRAEGKSNRDTLYEYRKDARWTVRSI
jgi:hypothetical protein